MRRGTLFGDFPVTFSIIILCLIFYGMEAWQDHEVRECGLLQSLTQIWSMHFSSDLGANALEGFRRGEVWRLIASAFLHLGALHLIMNMWVLLDLGRLCEPLLGRERFGVIYVACAIGGSLGSDLWTWFVKARPPAVGASGALMGLIGFLLGFSLRHKDRELRDQMLRWIIYIVLFTVLIKGIDHAGHVGGFITGALFGYFTPRYISSGGAKAWRIPFVLAAVATLISLGFGTYHFIQDLGR